MVGLDRVTGSSEQRDSERRPPQRGSDPEVGRRREETKTQKRHGRSLEVRTSVDKACEVDKIRRGSTPPGKAMAEIEIGPLTDRLTDEEIAEIARYLERVGAPTLPRGDESVAGPIHDDLDSDALSEFLDRLDAHDIAADIYLPIEFDGFVEVAELRVASATVLLEALDEVKEELAGDDDDDDEYDEDEDDDDRADSEEEQRQVWRAFYDGAVAAVDRKLPLHIRS
jgi:hypothetical protein